MHQKNRTLILAALLLLLIGASVLPRTAQAAGNQKSPSLKAANAAGTGKVKLTWNKLDGALSYQIFRSTEKNGVYRRIGTSKTTSYVDSGSAAGTKYYYKLKAVTSAGAGGFSGIVARTADLPKPTGLKTSNVAATGKVKVSWTPVEGAASYQVWRSTSKNGTYSRIKTVRSASCIDKAVTVGTKYYYRVKAVFAGNANANSAFGGIMARTADCAKPTGLTASNAAVTGQVILTWNGAEGATAYEVWRSTSKNGKYEKAATTLLTSFTDSSGETGKKYFYKVRAVRLNYKADSAFSGIVARTPDLARPLCAAVKIADGQTLLFWNEIAGAESYQVYRRLQGGAAWKHIGISPEPRYADSTSGQNVYEYRVRAVAKNANANSAFSPAVLPTDLTGQPAETGDADVDPTTLQESWEALVEKLTAGLAAEEPEAAAPDDAALQAAWDALMERLTAGLQGGGAGDPAAE